MKADYTKPLSLAFTLNPAADNVNCYWADVPENEVIEVGSFVGSVAKGGTVNYTRLSLTVHGNGTHTECIGHISADPNLTVDKCIKHFIFKALVITLKAELLSDGDSVLSLNSLKLALSKYNLSDVKALVIRSMPNDTELKSKAKYSGSNPLYPEAGIGDYLADSDIEHWLVDLPSVDREMDEGKLLNHRGFWKTNSASPRTHCSITELICVDNAIEDGYYELHLMMPKMALDAVPSQPILYRYL